METTMKKSCPLPHATVKPPVKEGKVRKVIRRIKAAIKGGKIATIRFDTDRTSCAVVNPKNDHKTTRTFEAAVMTDVTFSTVKLKTWRAVGCGSRKEESVDTVGVATGNLVEGGFNGETPIGARNIAFSVDKFVDEGHKPITKASKLFLFSDRRSFYIP